jgi:integrase/recombinase XerD
MEPDATHPTPRIAEAVQAYETTHIAARNFAARTRVEYRRDLQDLATFLVERCRLARPSAVGKPHLEAYLADLDRRGLRGSTRRRKVAAIRSFFGFLFLHRHIAHDPTLRLIPPEREHREPRVLTEAEYRRLQLTCANVPRDAALIELALQTGMRVSELAGLRLVDVTLPPRVSREHAGTVQILGKGRKQRTVTLNWRACRALRSYLAVRPDVPTERVFVSKFRTALTVRAIRNVVTKYLAEASIAGASVHTLRHTFGTQHARRGTNLRVIQEAMGHADLKTTSLYVHLARDLMEKDLQEHAL